MKYKKLIVYSTRYCSDCKALANLLDNAGIEYELILDEDQVWQVALENALFRVPIVQIGGETISGLYASKKAIESKIGRKL